MHENKRERSSASSEKRDPGFVKIRRGLLAHLRRMSSNATKLYLFLHLKAFWQGPKRGCVEANIDDLMFFLGWTRSMVKRTLAELVQKGYILFEGAANQHELGTIRITKFDVTETDSAQLTGEPSKDVRNSGGLTAGFTAGLSGGLTGEPRSEPSTPFKLQTHQDLPPPKNAVEIKKEKKGKTIDAVRRPVDAELHVADRPEKQGGVNPSLTHSEIQGPDRKRFSPLEKKAKLAARLAEAIQKDGDSFAWWIKECKRRGRDHPFGDDERQAFKALQYDPDLNSPLLSIGFVMAAIHVWEENRDKGLLPGILCCKVIDYCDRERKSHRTLGTMDEGYYYPPGFVIHRNLLRAEERDQEAQEGVPKSGTEPDAGKRRAEARA